ncbi:DUF6191 domain-containing protein [Streptomyces alboniger]|uniref:Uncharacterized protein n=1 Tax=Streptomyces alboniger TaxID=132473 RepID=A0A5J6HL61_STRAD|nr:DUF6191 domain-containing protein [Streptomyces alboniger]QEV19952.1 hypothetical protein CP975_22705 [Streptomyces alboniger]
MSVVWSEAVIPGLALLLFICCGTELVLRRFFKGRSILFRRSSARRPLTGHAFDEFNLIFNGNKLVEIKQQQQQEMLRDEEGDGAPPRTRIDLNKGIASVVLPGENGARDARAAGDGRLGAPALGEDGSRVSAVSEGGPGVSAVGGRSGVPDAGDGSEVSAVDDGSGTWAVGDRSGVAAVDGRSEAPDADRHSGVSAVDGHSGVSAVDGHSEAPDASERSGVPVADEGGPDAEEGSSR